MTYNNSKCFIYIIVLFVLLLLSWSIQLIRFLIHFPIDFTKLVNFNTRISLSVFQLMTRIVLSIFCSALVLVVLGKMAYALLYNPALILQPQPAWQVKKCFSCSQKRFEWAHTSSSHLQPEPPLSKSPGVCSSWEAQQQFGITIGVPSGVFAYGPPSLNTVLFKHVWGFWFVCYTMRGGGEGNGEAKRGVEAELE